MKGIVFPIEALEAFAEMTNIIRLAAKIAVIADHIKAEGYCATADCLAAAAKEIRAHAEKAINAASDTTPTSSPTTISRLP